MPRDFTSLRMLAAVFQASVSALNENAVSVLLKLTYRQKHKVSIYLLMHINAANKQMTLKKIN
jgi:hypothetical protein